MTQRGSILFYSKPECSLCDEGYEVVRRLARAYRLGLQKVDIREDQQLFEMHRYRIPVVELDGEELGWGRVSERALRQALENRLRF